MFLFFWTKLCISKFLLISNQSSIQWRPGPCKQWLMGHNAVKDSNCWQKFNFHRSADDLKQPALTLIGRSYKGKPFWYNTSHIFLLFYIICSTMHTAKWKQKRTRVTLQFKCIPPWVYRIKTFKNYSYMSHAKGKSLISWCCSQTGLQLILNRINWRNSRKDTLLWLKARVREVWERQPDCQEPAMLPGW